MGGSTKSLLMGNGLMAGAHGLPRKRHAEPASGAGATDGSPTCRTAQRLRRASACCN